MADDIQDWAKKRACDLLNAEMEQPGFWKVSEVKDYNALRVIARLVQQHEKPPVDPIEEEARKLACDKGYSKDGEAYALALKALRRGIELASQQGDG